MTTTTLGQSPQCEEGVLEDKEVDHLQEKDESQEEARTSALEGAKEGVEYCARMAKDSGVADAFEKGAKSGVVQKSTTKRECGEVKRVKARQGKRRG